MEKPKVAKPKLELFGESLLKFFVFQTVCLFSQNRSAHFISFLILHLKWWAVGFLQFWSNGPRLPSLSTLFLHPFCRRRPFSFPSVEVVSSFNFHLCLRFILLPSSEWVTFLCLARLAGVLLVNITPMRKKKFL